MACNLLTAVADEMPPGVILDDKEEEEARMDVRVVAAAEEIGRRPQLALVLTLREMSRRIMTTVKEKESVCL